LIFSIGRKQKIEIEKVNGKKNERFITISIVVRRENVILARNVQIFAKVKSWYPVDAASRGNVTHQLTVKKRGGNLPKAGMNVICNRSYTKKREAEIGEKKLD
jgi:hypothetical protein